MAKGKLTLKRDQIATFAPDPESIKQFEQLFQVVDETARSPDTQGIHILADNAQAAATEALAQLGRLGDDLAVTIGVADNKATIAIDGLSGLADIIQGLQQQPPIERNNSVAIDYIDLNLNAPVTLKEARLAWNEDDGTVDIGLHGGSILQAGQETMFYAKNTSGGTIANGTPVMFTGTVGASGKLTFGKAIATGATAPEYMMGVATQDIANNAFGYVTSFGLVRGFDTTGIPYGEVWADGDLLYFGTSAAGTWTNVQPTAPAIKKPVAVVVNAGAGSSGSIFVRMDLNDSLNMIRDVKINAGTLANDDILRYTSATGTWDNSNVLSSFVTSVSGTANRITSTGGTTPVIDIAATYVGQTSITTLGTVTTGVWNGTAIAAANGGTGQTVYAVGDILYASTTTALSKLPDVATGNVLLSGGVGVAPSYGKVGLTTHVSGILPAANGGTGVANSATLTMGGNVTFTGAFTTGITVTGNTSVTLPTSGTLYGTATGSITSAQLAASLTDETGTGANVFATSPTLVTPTLGAATATSLVSALNSVTSTQFDATSDVSENAIPGLTATLVAAGVYVYRIVLYVTSGAAGGCYVNLNGGTATVTAIRNSFKMYNTTTLARATTDSSYSAGAGFTGVLTEIYIDGTVTVNAGGTFIPRFCQNASSATTSSVLVGSSMLITRIS